MTSTYVLSTLRLRSSSDSSVRLIDTWINLPQFGKRFRYVPCKQRRFDGG